LVGSPWCGTWGLTIIPSGTIREGPFSSTGVLHGTEPGVGGTETLQEGVGCGAVDGGKVSTLVATPSLGTVVRHLVGVVDVHHVSVLGPLGWVSWFAASSWVAADQSWSASWVGNADLVALDTTGITSLLTVAPISETAVDIVVEVVVISPDPLSVGALLWDLTPWFWVLTVSAIWLGN